MTNLYESTVVAMGAFGAVYISTGDLGLSVYATIVVAILTQIKQGVEDGAK